MREMESRMLEDKKNFFFEIFTKKKKKTTNIKGNEMLYDTSSDIQRKKV